MKLKALLLLASVGVIAVGCWLVTTPASSQAGDIPEKYRGTVAKGLDYLASQQAKDGHWEGDAGKHPVAMTGLVGLALLMGMPAENFAYLEEAPKVAKTKHHANIQRAADWLMHKSHSKRDGLIFSEHESETARYMEGHGLATLFLAGVCRHEPEGARKKMLTDVLTRAVKYIAKAQSSKGGWYHTSKAEGHDFDAISATAIQMQALKAAENAGVPVPAGIIAAGQGYLQASLACIHIDSKTPPSHDILRDAGAAVAASLTVSETLHNDLRRVAMPKASEKWLEHWRTHWIAKSATDLRRDVVAHYYFSQAVQTTRTGWPTYRTVLFDHLQKTQAKNGDWPESKEVGIGALHASALCCIMLQLDKQTHPSIPPVRDIVITLRRNVDPECTV
ncbi:MAG TPA: prenyltransferase/squalene oxidase repeat-containing protein [Gemmataceae bacterium]|nr:prenyltransferase/squalene oxidase repeat-containing protein [Gemmataceae bacterium]